MYYFYTHFWYSSFTSDNNIKTSRKCLKATKFEFESNARNRTTKKTFGQYKNNTILILLTHKQRTHPQLTT